MKRHLLAEKQHRVLEVINRFGVITTTQLLNYFKGDISHVTIYTTKRKLVSIGFITEEKIGYDLIVAIKPSGVEYLGSRLTAFTKINFTLLNHHLTMNECIIALKSIFERKAEAFEFITERELRSEYLEQNFSKADRQNTTKLKHVPDRIPDFVIIENNEKIAYEVELTQKSAKRYIRKMERYRDEIMNGDYRMVRYLCENDRIRQTIIDHAKKVGLTADMLQIELIGRLQDIAKDQ